MGVLYKFMVVRLVQCERKKGIWERLRFQYRLKNKKRLLEKPLYEQTDCTIMGRKGVIIELPFTELEVSNMEQDYLEQYIQAILEIFQLQGCYLARQLSFLNDKFNLRKKWIFSYLLFEKGLELFLKQNKLSKKDARFVVIDSENAKIEVILQAILPYANYLTIVTDRSEYFQKAVEILYEETGLILEIVSGREERTFAGNVIINLEKDNIQRYTHFEEGALVVDLAFTNTKLEYLSNRKKGMKILFDYEITANGEALEQELMAEVMVRDNWKINRFATYLDAGLSPDEIEAILTSFNLKIVKLKIVSF